VDKFAVGKYHAPQNTGAVTLFKAQKLAYLINYYIWTHLFCLEQTGKDRL